MSTELYNFRVLHLQHRYYIGRKKICIRMEALNIKPKKIDNRAFINATQLEKLDRLDKYIKAGGAIADFVKPYSQKEDHHISKVLESLNTLEILTDSLEKSISDMNPYNFTSCDESSYILDEQKAEGKGYSGSK